MEENNIHLFRYSKFIETRPNRDLKKEIGYEIHHILPRSLGGLDEKINLIKLTYREHFIAHLILWKCYGGKMTNAFWMISNKKKEEKVFNLTSRQFEHLKKELVFHSIDRKTKLPKKVKVICEETGVIYESVRAAARENNAFSSNIVNSCRLGWAVWSKHFIYYEETEQDKYINNRLNKRKKKVKNLETEEVFNTVREAAKKYKVDPSCISDACNNESYISKGYHWRFLDDTGKMIPPLFSTKQIKESKEQNIKNRNKKLMKRVICLETGIIYESLKEASEKTNIHSSAIGSCCKGLSNNAGGVRWCYIDKTDIIILMKEKEEKPSKSWKKVICIETGITYRSISNAEKKLLLPRDSVFSVCHGKQKTAGGFHWEFVD